MRRTTILAGAICASLLALVFAGSASAKIVNLRVYDGPYPTGSFDGTGSVGPGGAPFSSIHQMDIDESNNNFLVGNNDYHYKFDSTGAPLAFSAIAPDTMVGTVSQSNWSDLSVDNSGEAGGPGEGEQGRVYGMSEGGQVIKAWKANGEPVAGPFGAGLNPGNPCGMDVAPDGDVWSGNWITHQVTEFSPDGTPTGNSFDSGKAVCGLEIDKDGNLYLADYCCGGVWKFSPTGTNLGVLDPNTDEAEDIAVDFGDGHIYTIHGNVVNEYDASGALVTQFGKPEGPYPGVGGAEGVAVDKDTHIVYVANSGRVDAFVRTGDITIPDVTTGGVTVTATTATVSGEVSPDLPNGGAPISECLFVWGSDPNNLNNSEPCEGTAPFSGAVEATLTGLTTGTTYYYKLTAANEDNNVFSEGAIAQFEPAGPPEITEEAVSDVNTDGATISARIAPGGGITNWRVEYGTDTNYGQSAPIPDGVLKDNLIAENVSQALSGLTPGTTYHYRVTAENPSDITSGADHTFTTFAAPAGGPDPCDNAQVRQQTGAAHLLDCRAYELASAPDTDGYDVTSNLVPGQVTLPVQPKAGDKVLYSLQFGVVPDTGDPTNFERDPYVATRGSSGWTTTYVGLPASGTPSTIPYGSPLAASSSGLSAFAFGNGVLCDPCFSDGSTGIPVRLANGSIVQGLKGSIPNPGAEPAGYIGQPLSDDGSHLIFGTTAQLESADTDGGLTIYDRNLNAGTTQVVSTQPNGSPLGGTVAGLDVSANGNRVLVGKEVSTDAKGNVYYDLYMHVGTSPNSVAVADTSSGVIFNGMTDDGSRVFFTTPNVVPGTGDADESADIFRADVSSSAAPVARVSNGNSDSCDPVPGKEGPDWNVLSGGPDCSALGLAGGAGVAAGDGTVFFLSPEDLDGSGTLHEANLYVARPGDTPTHVATLKPDEQPTLNALVDSEVHRFTDFQVTQNGDFAVLASTLSLTGFDTFDRSQVFRYDTDADAADALTCVSCATTGAAPTGNAVLSDGLNVADDGTVFFDTIEPLVLRDTNNRRDVYEWKDGQQELLSTGISNFDAGLLGVSANGVNAFFFTRETLVPQDENGETMKIYVARSGGGFLDIPPLPLCAAKDECHGPGTVQAPPPQIGTFKGSGGNAKKVKCKKPKVKRKGKCVKKVKCKKPKVKRNGKCVKRQRNKNRPNNRRHG